MDEIQTDRIIVAVLTAGRIVCEGQKGEHTNLEHIDRAYRQVENNLLAAGIIRHRLPPQSSGETV